MYWKLSRALMLVVMTVLMSGCGDSGSDGKESYSLPMPGGEFKIGKSVRHLTDVNREVERGGREIQLEFWYPAKTADEHKAEYIRNCAALMSELTSSLGFSGECMNRLSSVCTNARENSAVMESTDGWPVIILSHGHGSLPELSSVLAEDLSSNGYIVVGVNHKGGSAGVLLSDGSKVGFTDADDSDEAESVRLGVWADDMKFVIDSISDIDRDDIMKVGQADFTGKMDTSRIGIAAHSFGGAAAVESARTDSRIKAVVNLDGTMCGEVFNSGLNVPFLLMKNAYIGGLSIPSARTLELMGMSEEEFTSGIDDLRAEEKLIWDRMNADAYDVVIRNTGHNNFTDLPYFRNYLPADNEMELDGLSADRGSEIIRGYVRSFFGKYLCGDAYFAGDDPDLYDEVVVKKRSVR